MVRGFAPWRRRDWGVALGSLEEPWGGLGSFGKLSGAAGSLEERQGSGEDCRVPWEASGTLGRPGELREKLVLGRGDIRISPGSEEVVELGSSGPQKSVMWEWGAGQESGVPGRDSGLPGQDSGQPMDSGQARIPGCVAWSPGCQARRGAQAEVRAARGVWWKQGGARRGRAEC